MNRFRQCRLGRPRDPRGREEAMDEEPIKYAVLAKVRVAMRLHLISHGYYRRLKILISVLKLSSGASALLPVFQSVTWGPLAAAAAVTLISIYDAFAGFTERTIHHNRLREEYNDLLIKQYELDAKQLDIERLKVMKRSSFGSADSIRRVAFNDVMLELGHNDEVLPERMREKLVRLLS
jgi:hypothetical protein